MDFYSSAGCNAIQIRKVPLNADDKRALVAFLKTLTDEKFLRASANTGIRGEIISKNLSGFTVS